MANGTIVNSEAKWSGTIELNGVRAQGQFKVFNSAGGWAFLFGKPLLTTFKATHDYVTDSITVSNESQSMTLANEVRQPSTSYQVEDNVSLTMDIKQQETILGGIKSPPSRQVSITSLTQPWEKTDHAPKKPHIPSKESANAPMGQWKPPILNFKRQNQKQMKQIWKRVAKTTAHSVEPMEMKEEMGNEIPQEERTTELGTINVIRSADEAEPIDQLLGDLPEPAASSANPSIYTRQTNPFNPARITKILRQVTFSDDLTENEHAELREFVRDNTDSFALALSEVTPIPGAKVNLNVPENAKFNLRIHQCPLTPEQSRFYSEQADEMLKAGVIERAPPELIKCVATTVIAQKAHETGGLPLAKLK
ncbi:uncharacterized protein EDB91DRAFT_1241464 [Suillus paluster]|uniref:uncharacterized protein n=1 Tax=Suillus paluster TaxID=48578 RepID=UPI001B877BD6|nr:uncharacterized protein EDB91DRAFT_1241464 [Suillus paluster]KAG1756390.1 hypothetical protein EDB91DRAFT_1241464 [Suillus paluster]